MITIKTGWASATGDVRFVHFLNPFTFCRPEGKLWRARCGPQASSWQAPLYNIIVTINVDRDSEMFFQRFSSYSLFSEVLFHTHRQTDFIISRWRKLHPLALHCRRVMSINSSLKNNGFFSSHNDFSLSLFQCKHTAYSKPARYSMQI